LSTAQGREGLGPTPAFSVLENSDFGRCRKGRHLPRQQAQAVSTLPH